MLTPPPDLRVPVTVEVPGRPNPVRMERGDSVLEEAQLRPRRTGQDPRHTPCALRVSPGLEHRRQREVGHGVAVQVA